MIRDAQRGLLDTIPASLLYEEAPISEVVWESSRLFVSQKVPMHLRRPIWARLVSELSRAAPKLGASTCLTLVNANWKFWAPRVGITMSPMGPIVDIDGVQNQVVTMDFSSTLH
jgi:N-acyl-L-homoserine lactone synthetase